MMPGPLHSSPQSVSTSRYVPLNSTENESNSKLCAAIRQIFQFTVSSEPSSQWDTAGQERFRTITVAYYRGAMGILLVYDVTDQRSFDSEFSRSTSSIVSSQFLPPLDIRTWHSNIEQHASEGVNKILIGNKSDWNDKRVITEQQGRELAQELGVQFMETSAKVNEGVEEAFFTLARYLSMSTPELPHRHSFLRH